MVEEMAKTTRSRWRRKKRKKRKTGKWGGERGQGEMEPMGSTVCFSRNKANCFPGRGAVRDTNKMSWNLNKH